LEGSEDYTTEGLRSQLSEEISKPIYNNFTFIEIRNNIEILVSMVEMAYKRLRGVGYFWASLRGRK
jgi:hypothetical protein